MKETKIIIKRKTKLEDTKNFLNEYQKNLDILINQGFEIKASNMTEDNIYMYIYTLLEKE